MSERRLPELPLSAADIDAAKSAAGGWSKATLARWGVPWPPPKGWRKTLIAGGRIVGAEEMTDG